MTDPNNSKLKARILKGIRKDPAQLFADLTIGISRDDNRDNIRERLDLIGNLIEQQSKARDERKALSRLIGPAKKNNEDCSELISQVSQISNQIDALDTQIKLNTTEIEAAMDASLSETEKLPSLPLHLAHTPVSADHQTTQLSIRHADEIDHDKWQSFVESIAHSTIYHDARWKEIVRKNFNHPLYYITCENAHGELSGILPIVHLSSRLFGSFTISMPYFNYGGPLATSLSVEQALMTHAAALSESLGCSHMEIRETRARPEWQSVQRKVSMILPLPDSDELLDSALGSKIRAQVNKSKNNQLNVQFGGAELLDSFYKVFSRNMRDLGTPVYGKQFFADILNLFSDNAFLCVVYRNNEPLAAGFLLGHKDKLEIPWASSLRSHNHLGANMVMYRSILKEAISRNYAFFDFGRSTIDASTYKFKKQWGAIEHPLHWHYWTRDNSDLPQINPDNPKYKIVIGAWRLLPVFVTKIIGPALARSLP